MNVYIKHIDDGSDSLTHYGVKGMKWKKRKAIRKDYYNNAGEYTGHTYVTPKTSVGERLIKANNLMVKTRAASDYTRERMKPKSSIKTKPNIKHYMNIPLRSAKKSASKGKNTLKIAEKKIKEKKIKEKKIKEKRIKEKFIK